MDSRNQQNLSTLQEGSQKLALRDSNESKNKLDEMLGACLALQKLYGRDVANAGQIINAFHQILSKYPAESVLRAVETWMERGQEFPTPADIIGLIKRNGKPPLSKERYIAIQKKDGADRTKADWQYMRDYEADQDDGWAGDERDDEKLAALRADNESLRRRIIELEADNRKAWDEVKRLRHFENIEVKIADETEMDKVKRTIATMQAEGHKPEDIEAFKREYGIAA